MTEWMGLAGLPKTHSEKKKETLFSRDEKIEGASKQRLFFSLLVFPLFPLSSASERLYKLSLFLLGAPHLLLWAPWACMGICVCVVRVERIQIRRNGNKKSSTSTGHSSPTDWVECVSPSRADNYESTLCRMPIYYLTYQYRAVHPPCFLFPFFFYFTQLDRDAECRKH